MRRAVRRRAHNICEFVAHCNDIIIVMKSERKFWIIYCPAADEAHGAEWNQVCVYSRHATYASIVMLII